MSETVLENRNENTENIDQKALELAQDFSYDGFQVVRRELFAHLREPAVVIRRDSVTFNTACIAGLEDAVYIQILVNPEDKRMVVRKCEENDKDALRWCIAKPDKRKSRKMSNKIFSAMLYDMMGWSMDCRYKILMDTKRKKKVAEGTILPETVNQEEKTLSDKEKAAIADEEKAIKKRNRIPFYPSDWKDSFGLPVEEHKKALEINMCEGYVELTSCR